MKLWPLILAVAVAACQPLAAPSGPTAPGLPDLALPSMSTEAPLMFGGVPGLQLAPGDRLSFAVPPTRAKRVMIANTSADAVELGLDVQPPGQPLPKPTPAPGRETPPFGFGIGPRDASGDATSTDRRPPWGRLGVLQAEPPAVGKTMRFWINDGSTQLDGDRERTARVRLVTSNAVFLVDEADNSAISSVEVARLADAFESRIRPPLVKTFGEENRPGIDGENRLFIVLSSWVGQAPERRGMMGYFWPRDPVARSGEGQDPRQHANEKEVIFLSPEVLTQPEITGFGTLAHEYQHLLMFSAKSRAAEAPRTEETWLDEGFSMLAMDLAGFGLAGGDRFAAQEISDFQKDPGAYSLTDWRGNPNGHSYGLSYLFCRYLVDRFGLSIVQQVQATPETGVKGLDEVLRDRGTTFARTFVEWAIANRPKDETTSSFRSYLWFDPFGSYGGYQLTGATAERMTEATSTQVRPWGVRYLEVEGLSDRERSLILDSASAPLVVMEAQRQEE